jgi:hypothetical protein
MVLMRATVLEMRFVGARVLRATVLMGATVLGATVLAGASCSWRSAEVCVTLGH